MQKIKGKKLENSWCKKEDLIKIENVYEGVHVYVKFDSATFNLYYYMFVIVSKISK